MIEQTGNDYASAKYAKALMVSEAKIGKSSYAIATALGVFPGQKYGGIVDDPKNLHVITADANALGGIKRFLTETCGAPPEALGFRIYNMQEDVRRVSAGGDGWDYTLINTLMQVVQTIGERAKGVPLVHVSSLTGFAQALERSLAGPPGQKKGGGMDQSKWMAFAHHMNELRNTLQQDSWHCIWEAHIHKPPASGQDGEEKKETLLISGKAGQNFAYNVEQVFRLRRIYGAKLPGTKCDQVYLDTQPTIDFIANGRSFNETLAPKEPDPTTAFAKLGLAVGQWGNASGKRLKSGLAAPSKSQ